MAAGLYALDLMADIDHPLLNISYRARPVKVKVINLMSRPSDSGATFKDYDTNCKESCEDRYEKAASDINMGMDKIRVSILHQWRVNRAGHVDIVDVHGFMRASLVARSEA